MAWAYLYLDLRYILRGYSSVDPSTAKSFIMMFGDVGSSTHKIRFSRHKNLHFKSCGVYRKLNNITILPLFKTFNFWLLFLLSSIGSVLQKGLWLVSAKCDAITTHSTPR